MIIILIILYIITVNIEINNQYQYKNHESYLMLFFKYIIQSMHNSSLKMDIKYTYQNYKTSML